MDDSACLVQSRSWTLFGDAAVFAWGITILRVITRIANIRIILPVIVYRQLWRYCVMSIERGEIRDWKLIFRNLCPCYCVTAAISKEWYRPVAILYMKALYQGQIKIWGNLLRIHVIKSGAN